MNNCDINLLHKYGFRNCSGKSEIKTQNCDLQQFWDSQIQSSKWVNMGAPKAFPHYHSELWRALVCPLANSWHLSWGWDTEDEFRSSKRALRTPEQYYFTPLPCPLYHTDFIQQPLPNSLLPFVLNLFMSQNKTQKVQYMPGFIALINNADIPILRLYQQCEVSVFLNK